MAKPRKPLRLTLSPPNHTGWWAYSHNREPLEAIYLGKECLEDAQRRYALAEAVEINPVDIWSARRLKKRERCA